MTFIDARFYVHAYVDGKSVARLRHTWKCVPTLSPFSAYTSFPFCLSLGDFTLILLLFFNVFSPLPSAPFLSFTSVSSPSSLNTFVSNTVVAAQGLLVYFYFPFDFLPPSPPLRPLSSMCFSSFSSPLLSHFSVLVFAEPLSSESSLLLTIQHPLG